MRGTVRLLGILMLTIVAATACSDDDDNGGSTPAPTPDMDAGPDSEPDDDVGEPDVGEEEPDDPEPDGLAQDFCEASCGDIIDDCGAGTAVGTGVASCIDFCTGQIAEDPAWFGGITCMVETCDEDLCLGDDPPPAQDFCEEACSDLDECFLLGLLEIPGDDPEICESVCAGLVATDPDLEDVFECIDDALEQGCNEAAVSVCFNDAPPMGLPCEALCPSFFDPNGNDFCAEETVLRQTWSSPDDCNADCNTFSEEQTVIYFSCVLFTGCGDPNECNGIPPESFEGCDDGCDALFDLCGQVGGFNEQICSDLCTGFMHRLGADDTPDDIVQCVDDLGVCPEDAFGALLGCAIPTSQRCVDICSTLEVCDAEAAAECRSGCSFVETSQPEILEALEGCLDAAGDDCEAKSRCFGDDE